MKKERRKGAFYRRFGRDDESLSKKTEEMGFIRDHKRS